MLGRGRVSFCTRPHLLHPDSDFPRTYILHAEKIFASRSHYQQELARTEYRKARILLQQGKTKDADVIASRAHQRRRKIIRKDERVLEDLSEADFDDLIIFWSR